MEEIKLPLFTDDLIFYRKSQDIYKQKQANKFLGLFSEFSKASRYKMYIKKSTVFLCTCNEYMDTKTKNTVSFTIPEKKRNT